MVGTGMAGNGVSISALAGSLRKPPHCEGYTRRVLDAFHEDTHPRGCDLSVILQGIAA